jgi:diaminopimelate decarboxylase
VPLARWFYPGVYVTTRLFVSWPPGALCPVLIDGETTIMGNREDAFPSAIGVSDSVSGLEAAPLAEEPPGPEGAALSYGYASASPLAVPVKKVAGAARARLVKTRPAATPNNHFLGRYETADAFVADQRPAGSVHLMRPEALRGAAQWFIRRFPGTVLYAVKANPTPYVIKNLYAAGIRHFDVASLAEVELVSALAPRARMHFMHPVKSREAIRKSYFTYGVRDFVIDSPAELFKLLEETQGARDLGILIRLAVNNCHAVHALSGKFGADVAQTADLLQQARKVSSRLGIAFHVGQQTMNPEAWRAALAQVGEVVKLAKINPDIVDVGGGFPVSFPGLTPPPMGDYMAAIAEGFEIGRAHV